MNQISPSVILFDVDRTLFNNDVFKEKITNLLVSELNISSQELSSRTRSYQQSLQKYTDFNPASYLKHISDSADISELLSNTYHKSETYLASVYHDVVPTLEKLQTEHTLGVFSEANIEWQKQKIDSANLHKYFDQDYVFISNRKTNPDYLNQLPENSLIIDDNQEVISELLSTTQVTPIWINRIEAENQNPQVKVITSLSELPNLLSKKE
jgi:FMN phosphatase YigB (HAD superfamily)